MHAVPKVFDVFRSKESRKESDKANPHGSPEIKTGIPNLAARKILEGNSWRFLAQSTLDCYHCKGSPGLWMTWWLWRVTWVENDCCRCHQRSPLGSLGGFWAHQLVGLLGSGCRRWTESKCPCKEVGWMPAFLKTCKSKPFPESTLQNVLVLRAVLDVALAQLQAIGSILPIIIVFVKNVIHLRLRKLLHEISLSLSSVTNGRSSVSGSFSLFFWAEFLF